MLKNKKLTKNRSVTIPKDIAAATGILGGTSVDLVNVDDCILISPHIPVCVFCGESVPNKDYHLCGRTVCRKCADEVKRDYSEHYEKGEIQ